MTREVRRWLIALALEAPMLAVFAVHYLWLPAPGLRPTGFLQVDQPYYMANARAFFADGFHLTYGLPGSWDAATPRIYFQPLFLLLGSLRETLGLDPGAVYAAATIVAGLAFFRIAMALWSALFGFASMGARLAFLLLCWGGGVMVLTGALLAGGPLGPARLLAFDPWGGFWFLTLGRNVFFATEAFYHALVFGLVLLIVRRRFAAALGVALLLSASHPFTGVQTLAFVVPWAIGERVVWRSGAVGTGFVLGIGAVAAVHLGYYLWFLPSWPEHRALLRHWVEEVDLSAPFGNQLMAYLPVVIMAMLRLARERMEALRAPRDRLMLAWAAVSLALSNNHLLLSQPIQPLHFTRGYVWASLFLFGAPVLIQAVDAWLARGRRVVPAGLVALLLIDNGYWLAHQATVNAAPASAHLGRGLGWYLDADEAATLRKLAEPAFAGHLLVSDWGGINSLAATYTRLRSWMSYPPLTPDGDRRQAELARFFEAGETMPQWRGDLVIVVRAEAAPPWFDPATMQVEARYGAFTIVRRPKP